MVEPSQSTDQLYMDKVSSLSRTVPIAKTWTPSVSLSELVNGCMRRPVRENRRRASVGGRLLKYKVEYCDTPYQKGEQQGKQI